MIDLIVFVLFACAVGGGIYYLKLKRKKNDFLDGGDL